VTGILIQIGPGELADRLTILRIRERYTKGRQQRARIKHVLARLIQLFEQAGLASQQLHAVMARLQEVNQLLWTIEDDIRACEARQDFGLRFIRLARQVYKLNDERAGLKKAVDEYAGWLDGEAKIYTHDRSPPRSLRLLH
jgi:hypothetical protein